MEYVALDLETTGFDPERDRVIEVLEDALDRLHVEPAATAPLAMTSTRGQTSRL